MSEILKEDDKVNSPIYGKFKDWVNAVGNLSKRNKYFEPHSSYLEFLFQKVFHPDHTNNEGYTREENATINLDFHLIFLGNELLQACQKDVKLDKPIGQDQECKTKTLNILKKLFCEDFENLDFLGRNIQVFQHFLADIMFRISELENEKLHSVKKSGWCNYDLTKEEKESMTMDQLVSLAEEGDYCIQSLIVDRITKDNNFSPDLLLKAALLDWFNAQFYYAEGLAQGKYGLTQHPILLEKISMDDWGLSRDYVIEGLKEGKYGFTKCPEKAELLTAKWNDS